MPPPALSELVESITADAYGTDEQLTPFLTAFSEEVQMPCSATVLDLPVEVLRFDAEGDERRGLVARCGHEGRSAGVVSLTDVHFEGSVAARLHAAYRSWLGLDPSPSGARPVGAGPSDEARRTRRRESCRGRADPRGER